MRVVILIHMTLSLIVMSADQLAQMRLLQFLSPTAPVGNYSYSQGLEWAVNEGWIHDAESFQVWVKEQVCTTLTVQELPILTRLYRSMLNKDVAAAEYWTQFSVAVRDTAELRQEERNRGESYLRMLESIESINGSWPRSLFLRTPLASIAWFSVNNAISESSLLVAYAHNWLESSVITGVKAIPLGQSAGQKIIFQLASQLVNAVDRSLTISDDCVGVSLPAMSMASCGHEVLYSRIYRS